MTEWFGLRGVMEEEGFVVCTCFGGQGRKLHGKLRDSCTNPTILADVTYTKSEY